MTGAFYGDGARAFQDELDSRRLADAIAARTVHAELTADDIELIGAQSTVWMSTVDADGWPDVSYKGGDVGFVEVVTPAELCIPMYDGNGMQRTIGNLADTGRVALLFVDTARPWRLRIHGTATVSIAAADLERSPGAIAIATVTPVRIFPNCGRYIHHGDRISEYVPDADGNSPLPEWKRYPELFDALPATDRARLSRPTDNPAT